ncbi:MAG: hypothetical protein N2Z20_01405 [Elusimicrobiales bacterium]|nr:hypothetical protein [Elusimicrobiales bacterium]
MTQITFKYSLEKYPLEILRYTFYTLTSDYWILIKKIEKKHIEVVLTPKNNSKIDRKKLEKRIKEEIDNEIFRYNLMKENQAFRENIIKKAIIHNPPSDDVQEHALTPEEQKELEKLIKEAEEEIKKELQKEKENDIHKTWEEKYGKKNKR